MNIKNKRIGILGMARSGLAAAEKAMELGAIPFLSEFKPEDQISLSKKIKAKFACEFGGHSQRLLDCDFIVVSPGIPGNAEILKKIKSNGLKAISEIEFGFIIKHQDSKIIAITGSNGKSTTVSLIHHLLKTAGYNSILAGNIGDAFTGFPIEKPGLDFIVLELSSFQLELIKKFQPDVAAILNITPDHLNRYSGFDEYAATKFNIFRNMDKKDLAITNLDCPVTHRLSNLIPIKPKTFSLQKNTDIFLKDNRIIFKKMQLDPAIAKIKGPHNLANIMAAILAVSPYINDKEIIDKALATFKPLAHRMEYVTTINKISFYNDSKATNTDSVRYALQSFPQKIRIILGGKGKGEDFGVLVPLLQKQAEMVYLTGDTTEEMQKAFDKKISYKVETDFDECIRLAFHDSVPGDIIVLSPACTSYDKFKNFEQRGEHFKKLIKDLA